MVKGCVSCGFNHETFDHVFFGQQRKIAPSLVRVLREGVDALLGRHLPHFDRAVRRPRDEVLVVGGEGHAQDPAGVARERRDEAAVTPASNGM